MTIVIGHGWATLATVSQGLPTAMMGDDNNYVADVANTVEYMDNGHQ